MSVIILFCLSFLLVEYISWHFKGEKVQKNTQIVMCFLLLFIFFGFRDLPILNDTAHYYRHVRHLFSNTPFDNTLGTLLTLPLISRKDFRYFLEL